MVEKIKNSNDKTTNIRNKEKKLDIKVGKNFIMNYEELETRVAFVNNGKLEEYKVDRANSNTPIKGDIYLGKINKNDDSLQASFIDIGAERNAFLHYRDVILDDNKSEQIDTNKNVINISFIEKVKTFLSRDKRPRLLKLFENRRNRCLTKLDIPKFFQIGSEILVQITKGSIGTKGSRATANISIPGRYLVLVPNSNTIGLSKKIDDNKERKRLKTILLNLNMPTGMGIICRTVAEGCKDVYLQRDLDMLLEKWQQIVDSFNQPQIPSKIYSEPNLFEKTGREMITDDIDNIIIDDKLSFTNLKQSLCKIVGDSVLDKIHFYDNPRPVFSYYGLDNQIKHIFSRVARLPSGGYICVDETEALIAIDVNSGKSKGKDLPETILTTNEEAATEVARQLKLRDIGGLVVIDFIDMYSNKDRDAVFKLMKKLIKNDKARIKILPISKFGLMEMTRQRGHESLQDLVYDKCPYCHGRGSIKSDISMSIEIQRKLKEILKRKKTSKDLEIRIILNTTVLERLKNQDSDIFSSLEKEFGSNLSFRADDEIHIESFKIINPKNNTEY